MNQKASYWSQKLVYAEGMREKNSKKVLVTGGAGFVGYHLISALLNHHHKVDVIVRKSTSLHRLNELRQDPFLRIRVGDLQDEKFVNHLIKKTKPNQVFHLATAGAYHWQNDPKQIISNNIMGSINLFSALNKYANPEAVINVGTSSEYGPLKKAFKESATIQPMSFYAISKATQTHLSQLWSKQFGLPIITARLFTVYGPSEDERKLIPTLIRATRESKEVKMASPNTAHDYVYVDDVVQGLLSLVRHPEYGGEIFNLGSGKQTSLSQLIKLAEKSWQKKIHIAWNTYPSHRWDIDNWLSDQTKTKTMVGWTAKTKLSDGLKKTWKWFMKY